MPHALRRREFLRNLGLSSAVAPFLLNLPSLGFAAEGTKKQRLVVLFSPNGVVPSTFWPASFAITVFMTRPMSFAEVAPDSAIASTIARSIVAGSTAGGR